MLGLIAIAANFIPPPAGQAIAAIAGLATAILSLFGGGGPSDLEIMTDAINDQTRVLSNKIDEQTEVILKEFEILGK